MSENNFAREYPGNWSRKTGNLTSLTNTVRIFHWMRHSRSISGTRWKRKWLHVSTTESIVWECPVSFLFGQMWDSSSVISAFWIVETVLIYRANSMSVTYPVVHAADSQLASEPKITFSVWKTFKHHIPRFLLTILMDVILPLVIYFVLQKHTKPVYALLLASSPPLTMVIFKAIWSCTFDALGFLVFFSFAIAGVVAITTHNPIILVLEKSLATGVLSLIFAITLVPLRCCFSHCRVRPLAYYFYKDLVPTNRSQVGLPNSMFDGEEEQIGDRYAQLRDGNLCEAKPVKEEIAEVYEWIYSHCSSFRLSCRLITSIWAVGYFLEFLTRIILIAIRLPINKIVLYGHIILSSITLLCIVSTIACIAIERKHTLAFIERWKTEFLNERKRRHYRSESVIVSSPVDTTCSTNGGFTIDI